MNLFSIIVLWTLFSACFAAVYILAKCPEGHRPGEIWNEPSCKQCSCTATMHSCYSCSIGVFTIDRSKCYTVRNDNATYPECCKEKVICNGDPGFNASKLTFPENKTTITQGKPKNNQNKDNIDLDVDIELELDIDLEQNSVELND